MEEPPHVPAEESIPNTGPADELSSTMPGQGQGKPRRQFSDLSIDVKSLIVNKVPSITDLKSICLVNKELHRAALVPLYRHVCLELLSGRDKSLAALLHPSNPGLPFIRSVQLNLGLHPEHRQQNNILSHAQTLTRMILEFLPRDTLERFAWHLDRFSSENLLLLHQRQRKLKYVQVTPLDNDISRKLKSTKGLGDALQHVRQLSLRLDSVETLRVSQVFIEQTNDTLRRLSVQADFPDYRIPANNPMLAQGQGQTLPRDIDDTAVKPGLLTSTIFSHKKPFEKCGPLKQLRALCLKGINLRHCANTWCHLINFNDILELRLTDCPGLDALIAQMCTAASLPKKLETLELQHSDDGGIVAALNDLLCLTTSIQNLTIDLDNVKSLPAMEGIVNQRKNLRIINIHGTFKPPSRNTNRSSFEPHARETKEERFYTSKEIAKLGKACRLLEQVCLAFPPNNPLAAASSSGLWSDYENAILALPRLTTLYITTWPRTNDENGPTRASGRRLPEIPENVYRVLLQSLAQRMFDMTTPGSTVPSPRPSSRSRRVANPRQMSSSLRIIAFGSRDILQVSLRHIVYRPDLRTAALNRHVYNESPFQTANVDCSAQIIYIRGNALSPDGKWTHYAAPLTPAQRKTLCPARSEVLDSRLRIAALVPWSQSTPNFSRRSRAPSPGLADVPGPADMFGMPQHQVGMMPHLAHLGGGNGQNLPDWVMGHNGGAPPPPMGAGLDADGSDEDDDLLNHLMGAAPVPAALNGHVVVDAMGIDQADVETLPPNDDDWM